MLRPFARALSFCLVALSASAVTAHAQFYKLHNVDLGINATSPFTRDMTSDTRNVYKTTDTTGFVFSLREHPFAWAGVEVNYGYNKYSNVFQLPDGSRPSVKSYNHEFTGAYLFHPHFLHLQPFVGVGGGAIDFQGERNTAPNQWRGAGLLEVGFDIPTHNPHLGFRAQGRSLYYRAPNFSNGIISAESWVATVEPSGGVYVRF